MQRIKLYRYKKFPDWILGMMTFKEFIWYIGELLWKDNKQNISCIPPGIYALKYQEHISEDGSKYPAWEIVGVPGRENIEIHICNYPYQESKGCQCIGMGFTELGVTDSTKAYGQFMQETVAAFAYDNFEIEIVNIMENFKSKIKQKIHKYKVWKLITKLPDRKELIEKVKKDNAEFLKVSFSDKTYGFLSKRWKVIIGSGLLVSGGLISGGLGLGLQIIGGLFAGVDTTQIIGESTTKFGNKGEFNWKAFIDAIVKLIKTVVEWIKQKAN